MVNGKAKLVRENFCDGLGDCLPACPTGAITFEEREAPAYDEAAVKKAQAEKGMHAGGCPGSRVMQLHQEEKTDTGARVCPGSRNEKNMQTQNSSTPEAVSRLAQWPCQIKLVPVQAPFFDGAKLLIAADCSAYAYANMHEDFMRGKVTIIGCPKLDDIDYSEKLTAIIANNDIKEVTIVRMEVPCCGGLEMAAKKALQASGKFIPWRVVTISRDGRILD
jgi:ferredoxin